MLPPNVFQPIGSRRLTQMARNTSVTSTARRLSFKSPRSLNETQNPLPATFLRGGTSKGVFLNQDDLPSNTSLWPAIFLGLMGSPDPEYGRQLNGMGGGISSLSKICLVKPAEEKESKELDVDVEYTFVQVGIRDSDIDLSGNCGNLSSMIGVFAVDEGMCMPRIRIGEGGGDDSQITLGSVRAFNTNTQKVIETTFPVRKGEGSTLLDSEYVPDIDIPQTSIAGVSGKASVITLDFHNPSGARTGKLLPTGNSKTALSVQAPDGTSTSVPATLIDASNPTVIVPYEALSSLGPSLEEYTRGKPTESVDEMLESLRREGALQMGLDPSAKAQPKIAIVRPPSTKEDDRNEVDVVVHALSMGVLHKAVPMTLGLCLGVAANVEGSVVWDVLRHSSSRRSTETPGLVKLKHPSGVVDVGAKFDEHGNVISAQVVRTGRRLMKGHVWW
ncbi:hypothetical protein E1B28_010608 [Marasmius oreades]|uniref:DUF453-domain-containing protein n=1 Tax=Marasmius oreades TaxID=181124 RepID=A0A9P7RXN4_9AGAR|nr:uncharacterized protein E1B28_010608 [Marasmius oreades]KAG7091587.1 hypothetical protein E1B28_010608 [Marasmius oreades]